MKNYNNYTNGDDLELMTGADQLDSEEDDVTDVLNGEFDDIMSMEDEELDTLMDAEADRDDVLDVSEAVEAARTLVEECQGVNEDGQPKATVALTLEMVHRDTEVRRLIAQQAMYRPVVHIERRRKFIELSFTFPTAMDNHLRVMLANLDKYSDKVDSENEASVENAQLSIIILPIVALGSFYMVALNPVLWALQPSEFNGPINQLKVLVECEDVGFMQTDEMDIRGIEAAIQREYDAEGRAYDAMEAKEEAIRARNAEFNVFGGDNAS